MFVFDLVSIGGIVFFYDLCLLVQFNGGQILNSECLVNCLIPGSCMLTYVDSNLKSLEGGGEFWDFDSSFIWLVYTSFLSSGS